MPRGDSSAAMAGRSPLTGAQLGRTKNDSQQIGARRDEGPRPRPVSGSNTRNLPPSVSFSGRRPDGATWHASEWDALGSPRASMIPQARLPQAPRL